LLQEALVRLACIMHAASVHPEPGSNSPYENLDTQSVPCFFDRDPASSYHSSVVKVQILRAEHDTTPLYALSSPVDTNSRCSSIASAGVQTIRPLAPVSARLKGCFVIVLRLRGFQRFNLFILQNKLLHVKR
jgi:hypothetical protein